MSGDLAAPDDIKYTFKFIEPGKIVFPQIRLKELVFTTKVHRELIEDIGRTTGRILSDAEKNRIDDNLYLIDRTFKMDSAITYQELDSIDNPNLYTEDDVVEIFIRANSGGTRLGKSDLLFSLLGASWDVADKKMEELLDSLNQHGFAFDRDFVLKTCLVLLGQGARYEVGKFRKEGVRESIEAKWEEITKAIQDVLDYLRGNTFIQSDKGLPSYLVLIPLIYIRYHFPDTWPTARGRDTYILQCSLTGAFSGQPDNLLDALVEKMKETKAFSLEDAFAVIRNQGRSLELTEDRFWQMGYGSKTIHLLFNLIYTFTYRPAYPNNMPQVDHIFPQSALRTVKTDNPRTGRKDVLKYHQGARDQLANCMLLTMQENGPGGKGDTLPSEWFEERLKADPEYLKTHLIPSDKSLWELHQFENFIEARKKLLRERFKSILIAAPASPETGTNS